MTERLGTFRNTILEGDVRTELRRLPTQSVHAVVTSPPYWQMRDYGVPGQLGLESTPEEYVVHLVEIFHEIRRVLRKDGTVWLVLGDCYVTRPNGPVGESNLEGGTASHAEYRRAHGRRSEGIPFGLKHKDLVGIPWRVALALQADGWWLRQDNIFAKKNKMPESMRDRTTRSHEYIFHLSRSEHYYYDMVAIEEPQEENERRRRLRERTEGMVSEYALRRDRYHGQTAPGKNGAARSAAARQVLARIGTRNKRSVWWIATTPFTQAPKEEGAAGAARGHFAIFPEALVEPCILAATSEKGACRFCGQPLVRQIVPSSEYALLLEANRANGNHPSDRAGDRKRGRYGSAVQKNPNIGRQLLTTGWACGCSFPSGTEPSVVLDPFMGSGTTAVVAERLGRDWVGIELNPEYVEIAKKRLERARAKRLATGRTKTEESCETKRP